MRNTLYVFIVIAWPMSGYGQELQAKVLINHAQIEGTNATVFDELQKRMTQFLNEQKWTPLHFDNRERIACSFNITVNSYDKANNLFTCKALIQANRPVYNSAYTTTLFQYTDNDFNFAYAPFDQLTFNPQAIDNQLTALLAYYAYLIIGMDMDSFSPMGGEDFLNSCLHIANHTQGLSFSGWNSFSNQRNRYTTISNYMEETMKSMRQLQYDFYRGGLDLMAENTARARANITAALEMDLKKSHETQPQSWWPQLWTDFKRDELANIYQGHASSKEKETIYNILININASQSSAWAKIMQ